ncbi:MAG TPA: amidohydrolase family protein [Mycobacterium sp.]|nr:amidohydrolase family protein [Mycobacterium sp.]
MNAGTAGISGEADSIFYGGQIITMAPAEDHQSPRPEAVAVRGETIVFVGNLTEAEQQWRGDSTVMRDLAGRTLLPGFIDPHSHLGGIGLQATIANLLASPDGDVASIADIEQKLQAWAGSASAIQPAVATAGPFRVDHRVRLRRCDHRRSSHPARPG